MSRQGETVTRKPQSHTRMDGGRWLPTLLLLALLIAGETHADHHTGLSTQDLEAAARAAQTTRDFDGTRDARVRPRSEIDRLDQLQQQRAEANVQHGRQLTNLIGNLNTQQIELADARQRLASGQTNLAAYQRGETWYEAIGDFGLRVFGGAQNQGTRARSIINTAEDDIERLEAIISNAQSAIGTMTQSIQAYNERLDLEMRLADPMARRAIETHRMELAIQAVTDVETQNVQIGAGQEQFIQQLDAIDAGIEETRRLARESGIDASDIIERYENERETIVGAQAEWLESMYSELEHHVRTRDRLFEENADDRVGSTNTDQVLDEMRQRATAAGQDPRRVTGVDREALARTEGGDGQPGSAEQYSSGALHLPDSNSIFDGIDFQSSMEFIQDLREDELSWYEFSLRMGSYTRGVTRAGVDAVTDLAVLLREVGDTQGEVFEAAMRQLFGVDLDVFGDENLELLARVRDNAYLLWDTDNPEGRRVAEELRQLVNDLQRTATRHLERAGSRGDVHETLEDFGYVVGTVVGVEEVGLRVVGGAARATSTLWRAADTVEDIAAPTVRATGAAADSRRATAAGTDASRATPDGPDTGATASFDEDLTIPTPGPDPNATLPPTPETPGQGRPRTGLDQDDLGTAILPGRTARTGDEVATALDEAGPSDRSRSGQGQNDAGTAILPGRAARTGDSVLIEQTGDDTILILREGYPPIEARRIGSGSTTDVYEVPGRPDIVVKITRSDTGARALDQGGANVIRRIDPEGADIYTPDTFEQLPINGGSREGGTLSVAERAPDDFRRMTRAARGTGEAMTRGQRAAYRRAMNRLNDEGFVWLDNKGDNYSFYETPPPGSDEWTLIVMDPGGIVPMRNLDPEAARALQHAIDNPPTEALDGVPWDGPAHERTGRGIHQQQLAERFDDLIDWEAIQRLTGLPYRTLGRDFNSNIQRMLGHIFPFNPKNGRDFPEINLPLTEAETASRAGRTATGGERTPNLRDRTAETVRMEDQTSVPYTGTRRNPARFPDEDDESADSADSDAAISMGGEMGTSVVPLIFFAFGPGVLTSNFVGLYTHCWPCSHLVNEYNDIIANTLVYTPEILTRLSLIRMSLPLCEAFSCQETAFLDLTTQAVVELIRVINVVGNSPYNQLNPTGSASSSGPMVQVLALFGGGFARLDQFSGIGSPEPITPSSGCEEDHYHVPHIPPSNRPLIDCEGNERSDQRPSRCGFGTVEDVRFIPADQCPNP